MSLPSDHSISPSSFKNLVRRPQRDGGEIFGSLHEPSDNNPSAIATRIETLARIIAARGSTFWDGSQLPGALSASENPDLEAGYAFFLQFIAHDLVDTQRHSRLEDGRLVHENAILHPLNLDTLYGFGMGHAQPSYLADQAYLESRGGLDRARFRLEPKRDKEERPSHTLMCPFRDLARQSPGPMMDDPVDPKKPLPVDPCIADPRNDSSAILSQLVVIFHLFHNLVFDHLEAKAQRPQGLSEGLWRQRLFHCTRRIVLLAYHTIIVEDLLPKVLHPVIAEAYRNNPRQLPLDRDLRVSLEFSKGLGRFGHVLLSSSYRLNSDLPLETEQGILRSSRRRPDLLPLEPSWLADWSRFFAVNAPAQNHARRIGPSYAGTFASPYLFPTKDLQGRGLITLDMIAGIGETLWSVPALIEMLHDRFAEEKLLGIAALLKPYSTTWQGRILTWLTDDPGPDFGNKILPVDAEAIAEDPPLSFFIQFEAAIDPAQEGVSGKLGHHLGPLGSILLAETIYAALNFQGDPSIIRQDSYSENVRRILTAYVQAPDLSEGLFPTPIASMADLLLCLQHHEIFS